ncbi:TetR/AcrR family transcriptional regulator [Nocardia mexicana]|uniref:TetR family transcriptional regulator n=1 Tax=Nocardia mexicana TaxID=279262 RepID=A0A370HAY7_9NOCA|nr:TetR/AcrR family transcriptional regulator [Nocardia mexicana]RDI54078.1 TetR family transcriptional regulator [Nocardia mexicana]
MSAATGTSPTRPARGRIDKQQAVLAAAFAVFARVGYAQARVDEIAAEAKVAKATVYNHFGDKDTLFREAVRALSDSALAANLAAVERLEPAGGDVAAALRDVGVHLAACYCAEDSRALRRLICAEAAQFPDLLDVVDAVSTRVVRALADRLARLALAGALRLDDPDMAAAQFAALLSGPADARSRFGTRAVPESELRTITDAAVTTFLAAYAR